MCTRLLLWELQNCNLLLNKHQQENVGSYHKKISHIQGQRRSSNKMEGEKKLHLESNPKPTRDARRAERKRYAHEDSEVPQRLNQICFECLSVSCKWQPWGQGLCLHQTWVTSLWHKPSWRRSPLAPLRAAEQTPRKLQKSYTKEIVTLLRKF